MKIFREGSLQFTLAEAFFIKLMGGVGPVACTSCNLFPFCAATDDEIFFKENVCVHDGILLLCDAKVATFDPISWTNIIKRKKVWDEEEVKNIMRERKKIFSFYSIYFSTTKAWWNFFPLDDFLPQHSYVLAREKSFMPGLDKVATNSHSIKNFFLISCDPFYFLSFSFWKAIFALIFVKEKMVRARCVHNIHSHASQLRFAHSFICVHTLSLHHHHCHDRQWYYPILPVWIISLTRALYGMYGLCFKLYTKRKLILLCMHICTRTYFGYIPYRNLWCFNIICMSSLSIENDVFLPYVPYTKRSLHICWDDAILFSFFCALHNIKFAYMAVWMWKSQCSLSQKECECRFRTRGCPCG